MSRDKNTAVILAKVRIHNRRLMLLDTTGAPAPTFIEFQTAMTIVIITIVIPGLALARTRNLEILRCAIAHHSSMLCIAPE
jgi:hypothetical protein